MSKADRQLPATMASELFVIRGKRVILDSDLARMTAKQRYSVRRGRKERVKLEPEA